METVNSGSYYYCVDKTMETKMFETVVAPSYQFESELETGPKFQYSYDGEFEVEA